MATSKQSFVRATEPQYSVSAQREEEMHVKAPFMTMYVHNGSAPGLLPYSQAQHGALQDTTFVPLFLPGMCSNQPLSALTLQISNSTALQQQRLGVPAISSRPKSIGKHVCQHCGKDCLKPSVLEKHLRCHTGERPYPCTTCGISFKTQSNLYKHKRTQAHARLSNESDKGTFSSQESMDILKDNCISSSSVMHAKDSADINKSDDGFPVVSVTTHSQVHPVECKIHKADVDRFSTPLALQDKASFLSNTVELSSDVKDNSLHKNPGASCNNGRGPLTPNRTPLQRQEALFSKPWESPASRGKSQSHDSTDSGFSDSCEHHLFSSSGSSLHDPSVESLAETSMEHQEIDTSQAPSKMTPDDPKNKVSIQEKQKLEERISKLIYENSVLVEDKQLETVRPRKTILSKQGSIDLPVPYTYKDSFHFEIRSSKHIASLQKQDRGGGTIYRSVPTQHSTSPEHAPLTRSSSLPFSVGSKRTDGVNNTNLSRRCSAGHVYPFRSTDQVQSHRSLVRQAAIDCLPPLDGSSVDRGSISSLSSDGDSTEIVTESTIKGNYRKKTRKFDYTKWHTYKGGTFTKLYNTDRDGPLNTKKTMPGIEQTESFQISQPRDNASMSLNFTSCSIVCLSKTCDMSSTQKANQASSSYVVLKSPPLEKTAEESKQIMTLQNDPKHSSIENSNVRSADVEMKKIIIQSTDCHLPSERKKQRTTNDVHMLSASCPRKGPVNANLCGLMGQPLLPTCGSHSSIKVNVPHIHRQSSIHPPLVHQFTNPSQLVCKTLSPTYCFINMHGKSGSSTLSTSIPALSEAKTSFPPKYQLKIPYSTDGALASCSVSTSAPKTSQTLPAISQNHPTNEMQCHLKNSLPSSKQGQAASKVAVCETTSKPMLSVSSSGQFQTNTVSSALTQLCTTPTSHLHVSPVAIPVQQQMSLIWNNCAKDVVENQSTGPLLSSVTSLNTVSAVTSGSAITTTSPTLQSHPTTSVFTFENTPKLTEETQCTVCESTLDSTASNITTDESQVSKSAGKVILLSGPEQSQAQNTFYVRTADLQIVMQLISDEQLALIQPHIETPDFKPAQSYCANYRNPVTTKSCDNDDGIDVCITTQDMINNGAICQTSDKISLDSCESADSEKKTESAGGLTLLNAKNNTGVNSSTVCISSWSHQQTKVHTSASSSNRKNPTKQFYNPHIIPKKLNVTTESHHKQVAGDIVSELDLADKSFSMRQNDKECSSPDRVIFSKDQTSADMNPELNNETSVSKEMFCLLESNHNQAIQKSNKTRSVTVLRDDEGLQTMKTTQFGFADEMIPITTPSIATSQQMQKVLTSTIQPCQSKLRWPACSASTQLKEYGTESGEDGAPWFQRNPGTPSQESIPREPKSAGTDMEKLDTKMADTNNPCQSCENNGGQDKRKVESSEEHQTAAQTHLRLSQEVINASLNVSNPAHHEKFSVPNNPAPSVCNILSQTCQFQGQEGYNNNTRRDREDGVFGKGPSQETSQRASASSGLGVSGLANQARRHLLECPQLVNDKRKETHTRNVMNYWTSAKDIQAQVISPQQRVLQNHCSVLTTSMTSSSCTGLMHSNAPHKTYSQLTPTNQICPLATVSTSQTDSKLFYTANNSYLKHEDSNSSSDDEQKLIIELE